MTRYRIDAICRWCELTPPAEEDREYQTCTGLKTAAADTPARS